MAQLGPLMLALLASACVVWFSEPSYLISPDDPGKLVPVGKWQQIQGALPEIGAIGLILLMWATLSAQYFVWKEDQETIAALDAQLEPPDDVKAHIAAMQMVVRPSAAIEGGSNAGWLLDHVVRRTPNWTTDCDAYGILSNEVAEIRVAFAKKMGQSVPLFSWSRGVEKSFHPLFDLLISRELVIARDPNSISKAPGPWQSVPPYEPERFVAVNAKGLEVWRWSRHWTPPPQSSEQGPTI